MNDEELDDLLEEARRDGNPGARDRLLGKLAVASATGLAVSSAKAALALEVEAAFATTAGSLVAGAAKAAVVGGTVGAAVGVVTKPPEGAAPAPSPRVERVEPPAPPPSPTTPASPTPTSPTPTSPTPTSPTPTSTTLVAPPRAPQSASSAEPALPGAVASPAEAPAPPAPSPPAPRELDAALQVLERARSAVARGDGAEALRHLDGYGEVRGAGTLDPEAALLRIQALRRAGRPDEARERARAWLDRDPDTPFADALRAATQETP